MVRVGPARGVSGEVVEAIEGISGEIHVDDQYDQSSKNSQLAGPVQFFFSEKERLVEISSLEKKRGPGQISTGLVVLVVDMDSALFCIVVLLGVSGVKRGGWDMSPTLSLTSSSPL